MAHPRRNVSVSREVTFHTQFFSLIANFSDFVDQDKDTSTIAARTETSPVMESGCTSSTLRGAQISKSTCFAADRAVPKPHAD